MQHLPVEFKGAIQIEVYLDDELDIIMDNPRDKRFGLTSRKSANKKNFHLEQLLLYYMAYRIT